MKRFKAAVLLLLLSVSTLFTACEEISQKPLNERSTAESISDEVDETEETVEFTEYAAEIPEITPVETSLTVEAEDCKLNGNLEVADKRKGYSGNGYVTGFMGEEADYLLIPVDLPASQHYDITVCVAADTEVINNVLVNDNDIGTFIIEGDGKKFDTVTFYGVYMDEGKSVIQIYKGNNEFDIDYIKVSNNSDVYEDELEITADPVSEKSSYEARDVLRYFKENLGENIITGQYVSSNKNKEMEYIHEKTGQYPVIRFSDIGGYGESKPPLESEIKAAREWDEKGGIVGFMWHWNSPAEDSSVYAIDTKFDLEEAVTDEDIALLGISEIQDLCRQGNISSECLALIEDIDAVSAGLMQLCEDGIPVLWRPLHEAGNNLYWWSAYGEDAYIWLYELMFERMTKYHELDNLIWIWNGQNEDYLVDEDKYDIAAINIYLNPNTYFGSRSEQYQWIKKITENEKMIALSECSTVPGLSEMLRDNAVWTFFGLWYGEYLSRNEINPDEIYTLESDLIRMYNAENSITLEEYAGVYGHQ
ncbi:MAG: hypothetical protein IJA12_00435 [Oscillospiraceae bacterium]|nr:hypothetical protein [Oscillospiraceae bacterium]